MIRSVPDACTVATSDDITQVFHASFERQPAGKPPSDKLSRCLWKRDKVELGVHTEITDRDSFEDAMETLPGAVKKISVAGETAYYEANASVLYAFKGDTKVALSIAGSTAPTEPDETALMAKILGKL